MGRSRNNSDAWKGDSEYSDPDAWKNNLDESELDVSDFVSKRDPLIRSSINELGVALRPSGPIVISNSIKNNLQIKDRLTLRNLSVLKDKMKVFVIDTKESFQYYESRNLWVSVKN